MCGIAGLIQSNKDIGEFSVREVAKELLLQIESRGRDSTGAAWYDQGGTLMVQKDGLPAKEFVPFLELPNTAHNVILHTRAQTQGSHLNNDNNHPVITGGIVGVHNGGVWNDDGLFRKMNIEDRRIAQVDTEAIFAAIAYGMEINPETGKPRLGHDLNDVLEEISGSAAIAWLEVQGNPELMHVARISGSPLIWGQTPGGSFMFASTKFALESACRKNDVKLEHIEEAPEGVYMRVRSGMIENVSSFKTTTRQKWSGGTTTINPPKATVQTSTPKTDTPKTDTKTDTKAIGTGSVSSSDFFGGVKHREVHHAILDIFAETIDDLIGEKYYKIYELREVHIDEFLTSVTAEGDQRLQAMQVAGELHAHARPGDWVFTDVPGFNRVRAQILTMPMTFPTGSYVLRVLVPNQRYKDQFEPVIVERTSAEFETINPNSKDTE